MSGQGVPFGSLLHPAPDGQAGSVPFFCISPTSPFMLWQGSQKWVVPKQNHTATEQQYRHLNSRKSVPCLSHTFYSEQSIQQPSIRNSQPDTKQLSEGYRISSGSVL